MKVSQEEWNKYIERLASINEKAADVGKLLGKLRLITQACVPEVALKPQPMAHRQQPFEITNHPR